MRPAASARHRSSGLFTFFFVLLALFAGTTLTLAGLWAMGVDLPFLSRPLAAATPDGIPVPLSGRPIAAYTKLTRDHFIDPNTGHPMVRYLSPEAVKRGEYVTDLGQLIGRVINRDKSVGFGFKEDDLCPKGTRPGLVAGIPQGKRAFVLPADKVAGIHGLKPGDRFDLVGSVQVDLEKAWSKFKNTTTLDPLMAVDPSGTGAKRANIRPLVQNGVVVLPLTTREVPFGTGATSRTGPPQTKPVQEITVAIEPQEVAPLTEALSLQAQIICVARTGLPEGSAESTVTPGSPPPPPLRTMEMIINGKRQVLVFPTPGQGPQEPDPNVPPPGTMPIQQAEAKQ